MSSVRTHKFLANVSLALAGLMFWRRQSVYKRTTQVWVDKRMQSVLMQLRRKHIVRKRAKNLGLCSYFFQLMRTFQSERK